MTPLPASLNKALDQALKEIGDPGPVVEIRSQGGGCINHASQVVTKKNQYFLKWNPQPLPNMFTTESLGLKLLAAENAIRVPAVIKAQEAHAGVPAFILL
jgi:fructosamine-3-kinase